MERVNLSGIARRLAAEMQARDPERSAEFVIADGVTAWGDPELLRAAMQNLIENAWKYTRKHATARIEFGEVSRAEGPVYFVRDDGAGFDMDRGGKLFSPFQRLHESKEFEGTGIGLATVDRIVRRHGGRIWAESAVERGAAFFFTLQQEEIQ
jgi:light-regulated signal transduction histidine kinase (bacteriophytochrome)